MENIRQLIDRFWAGTATDSEKQQLFSYLREYDADWRNYLLAEYELPSEEQLTADASRKIHAALRESIQSESRLHPVRWKRWAVAAAVILLAGAGIYTYRVYRQQDHNLLLAEKQMIRFRNIHGSPESRQLPDGSAVTLQPGAVISYTHAFGHPHREVVLEGAGFFEVLTAAGHPFRVTAGGMVTTVLGTSFYVNATDTAKVSVKLISGKVMVNTIAGSSMIMRPIYLEAGQELVVNKVEKKCYRYAGGNAKPTGQETSPGHQIVMAFSKTPLPAVFRQLEAYYQVRIVADAAGIEKLSFTGAVEKTDSVHDIIRAICLMNDLLYKQEGNNFIISNSN